MVLQWFNNSTTMVLQWFNNRILPYFSSNPRSKIAKYDEDNEEYYNCIYCHDDILMEILTRVPADRLHVFKRVCRHWRELISSYDFLKLHIKRAKDEASNKLVMFVEYRSFALWGKWSRQQILLRSEENLADTREKWKQCELYNDLNTTKIIGSCDGLLMFQMPLHRLNLIVNPITQESRIITCPARFGDICCIFFDRFECDYKLLHLFPGRRNSREYDEYIYSFKRDEWTRLKHVKTHHLFLPCLDETPVLLNDALHWIRRYDFFCSMMVLVFKIENKELLFMRYPSVIIDTEFYNNCCLSWGDDDYPPHGIDNDESQRLIEKDGQLCLCHVIELKNVMEIWVLQNYGDWESWVRMFKIDLYWVWNKYISPKDDWYYHGHVKSVKIVSFNDDDDILIAWPHGRLLLYNLKTKKIKLIEGPKVSNFMGSLGSYVCIPLTKTLLSPNNMYTTSF